MRGPSIIQDDIIRRIVLGDLRSIPGNLETLERGKHTKEAGWVAVSLICARICWTVESSRNSLIDRGYTSMRQKIRGCTTTPPLKCGDVNCISGVSIIRSLSVSEPRGLDQPVNRDIILGIVDLGGCWVSFKDLECGKHDSAR
jgi:hypothetical protein